MLIHNKKKGVRVPVKDWKDMTILIAEDSQTQAMLLQEILKERGPKVIATSNGSEALEAIKKGRPTIVISDVEMPEMNGYDLCRSIKSDPNFYDIPVILLTALSDPLDVIKGIQCGADYFLTKPCKDETLFTYMEDALDNRKLLKTGKASDQLDFYFRGQRYLLPPNSLQITDLLLSTYSSAIQKNQELEQAHHALNMAHQELQKRNEELSRLNNTKNQLLGMAAHDLRNPLGIILGYTNLLISSLGGKVDDKSILKLEHIKKSSGSMLNLINELLDISAIESGKVQLNLSQQNLVKLIENIISLNQIFYDKKQITLQFKHEKDIPDIICDPQKIEQVITNLLTNALKFSRPDTTVEISITKHHQEILVAVKDQGIGIPESEIPKLFQTFSRTSAKSTAGEPSTGLGLAIAKKIVAEHKGKIWAESEVGKGSTFFFTLPINT